MLRAAVQAARAPLRAAAACGGGTGAAAVARAAAQSRFPIGVRGHQSAAAADAGAARFTVTYVDTDGSEETVQGVEGENLLELAHKNGVELEGACEGSLACSTCHVYVDPEYFDRLPEACEEEEDMLDLAFALTSESRLGCQIVLGKEIDGIRVTMPPATRNMAVDGFVPKPH